MIEAYLRLLDALLGTSALVHDVEIVRRLIQILSSKRSYITDIACCLPMGT